jgi:hypothetical protein
MRKLLLAISLALAAILMAGLAQAQLANPGCAAISCMQSQANVTNPITTTTTTTTATANNTTTDFVNKINAALQGSVLNAGTLSQTTTNTWTSATTSAVGGAGSAFNTANLAGNTITQTPTDASVGGAVTMVNSISGQGILQATQNTGTNSVQQNSVALTSWVGGTGGGLSGFSPAVTAPAR